MKKGKTASGFKYQVDETRIFNDLRFTMALSKSNSKDIMKQLEADAELVGLLLGEEQAQRLYDYVKEPDGMIPRDKVTAEVIEILDALGKETNK